jgi:hypothetical protein
MATTWFEQGVAKGMEQGQRNLLRMQLETRFGPLTAKALEQLSSWPADKVLEFARSVLTAQSLQELGLAEQSENGSP